MRRLLGRFLVAGVLLAGAVAIAPFVWNVDWQSGFSGRSNGDLTAQSVAKIRNGMNRPEVTAILGPPSEDRMGSLAGSCTVGDGSRFLVWSDGHMEVRVHFSPEGFVISTTRRPLSP